MSAGSLPLLRSWLCLLDQKATQIKFIDAKVAFTVQRQLMTCVEWGFVALGLRLIGLA